jgi:carboxyl-terminal processing protease
MAPGETKTARFQLEVKKGYNGSSFPLKLAIIDEPLEEFSTEKLQLQVGDAAAPVESRKGTLKAPEKTELFDSPQADAKEIALLPKGGLLNALGTVGAFFKVEIDKDRFAFVRQSDVKDARGAAAGKSISSKDVEYVAFRVPPRISLNVEPSQGGTVVNTEKFTLTGTVTNVKTLLDMYVLVNDKKVFFKSASLAESTQAKFRFTTDFSLKEGNNYVLVVARESPEFAGRRTLVIRRRPAAVAQKISKP